MPTGDIPVSPFHSEEPSAFIEAHASSIPSKYHERNEDQTVLDFSHNIFGVIDGMGGHESGAEASRLVAEIVTDTGDILPHKTSPRIAGAELKKMLQSAHLTLNERSIERITKDGFNPYHPSQQSRFMGATAVLAKFYTTEADKSFTTIASAGDSRAYLFRDGILRCLTVDHDAYRHSHNLHSTKRFQMKASNAISNDSLTNDELPFFRRRNEVSSSVGGGQPLLIDLTHQELQPGDRFAFFSDGVTDNLTTKEIQDTFRRTNPSDTAVAVTERAERRSLLHGTGNFRARIDDITAVTGQVLRLR
ncbi:MAG: PP2C family serine/threonine-protein phosphatase [Candidatus Microsaccharimonas sp.]